MRGVNKAILIGNLGQDPELKSLQNGVAVCRFSLATNESWQDKQTGEKVQKTEWHHIVLFNKLAESAAKYYQKGTRIYLEGKLQTRKWQDQHGIDHYVTEIIGQSAQIESGGKFEENAQNNPNNNIASAAPQHQTAEAKAYKSASRAGDDYDYNPAQYDDEIPF